MEAPLTTDKLELDFAQADAACAEAYKQASRTFWNLTDAVVARHSLLLYDLARAGISPYMTDAEREELKAAEDAAEQASNVRQAAFSALYRARRDLQ